MATGGIASGSDTRTSNISLPLICFLVTSQLIAKATGRLMAVATIATLIVNMNMGRFNDIES